MALLIPGKDTSGNSNDWTAIRFETREYEDYTSYISFENCSLSSGPIVKGFDGNTATMFSTTNAVNSTIVFAPTNAITINDSMVFRGYIGSNQGYSVKIGDTVLDSGTNTPTSDTYWVVPNAAGKTISTSTPLRLISSGSGEGVYWNSLIIDGVELLNPQFVDNMVDSPTAYGGDAADGGGEVRGNYATVSSTDKSSGATLSDGNFYIAAPANSWDAMTRATIGISSGKWYWEVQQVGTGGFAKVGVRDAAAALTATTSTSTGSEYAFWSGNKQQGSTDAAYGSAMSGSYNIVGVALDMDNGKIWWSLNGTWAASGDPAAGTNAAFTNITGTQFPTTSSYNVALSLNFGQLPFAYTPPSGYKSLNTKNLNEQAPFVNGPDLIITKARSTAGYGADVTDSVRGIGKSLFTDSSSGTSAETVTGNITEFKSNGYVLASGNRVGANGTTYVSWCWNAGNKTVANNEGTIPSLVKANPTAGFSIVSYIGTGVDNSTIGHGLGKKPDMIIIKKRSATDGWPVWHKNLTQGYEVFLNTNALQAADVSNATWGDYHPSNINSNVFGVGYAGDSNSAGDSYIAYCFSNIAGYSAFGAYDGNSSTDGPFINTGFTPKLVMIKCRSGNGNWEMFDTARSPYNPGGKYLRLDSDGAEVTGYENSYPTPDLLSNGFKCRSIGGTQNDSQTYVYAAFAASPFKYANAR